MTTLTKSSLIAVAVVLAGCGPSRQSTADTTVAATSTTSVIAAPVDTLPAAATTAGSKTTTGSTTTKTTVTTTKKGNESAQDPNIIGRDRVLRFPRRSLPAASSTPQR